jgi:hypothetical protein
MLIQPARPRQSIAGLARATAQITRCFDSRIGTGGEKDGNNLR